MIKFSEQNVIVWGFRFLLQSLSLRQCGGLIIPLIYVPHKHIVLNFPEYNPYNNLAASMGVSSQGAWGCVYEISHDPVSGIVKKTRRRVDRGNTQ